MCRPPGGDWRPSWQSGTRRSMEDGPGSCRGRSWRKPHHRALRARGHVASHKHARRPAHGPLTDRPLRCAFPPRIERNNAMGISRHATAHWEGDLKSGKGILDTPQSGLLAGTRYGFNSRFGEEKGTNPEELIAAAHAGCFTMALSAKLGDAGFTPAALDTRAEVDLSLEGGPALSQIRLKLKAKVPGIDEKQFR